MPAPEPTPPSLARALNILALIAVTLASLTYLEKNFTDFVDGFGTLSQAVRRAFVGPDPVKKRLAASDGVSDGDTSDGSKAYRKSKELCIYADPDAKILQNTISFKITRQSNPERAFARPKPDNNDQRYCITLSAGTGDKKVLEIIEGELSAYEEFAPGKGPASK